MKKFLSIFLIISFLLNLVEIFAIDNLKPIPNDTNLISFTEQIVPMARDTEEYFVKIKLFKYKNLI